VLRKANMAAVRIISFTTGLPADPNHPFQTFIYSLAEPTASTFRSGRQKRRSGLHYLNVIQITVLGAESLQH
jgi:hypothetical protein